MIELYKKRAQSEDSGGVNPITNPGLTVSQQNEASNAPGASSGTPGAMAINDALIDYEELNGESATSVQQLLNGYLSSIPDPPEGMQWVINGQGNVAYIPL